MTVFLAGLAGCSGSSSSSGSSSAPETAENVATDPSHHVIRGQQNTPLVWVQPDETRQDTGSTTAGDRHRHFPERGLIATRETANRLMFADIDGGDAARSFVEETEFDRETLLLDPNRTGECFKLDLCYITWSATEYHTYYARLYRDVEVACEADASVGVVTLIRIPDTLDPEQVTGSGSGTRSGTCHGWRRRLERRRAESNTTSRPRPDRDTASIETISRGQ